MLLTSLNTDRPAISAAFDSEDNDALLEKVHKLHGATRYCGTPRLEAAAKVLEESLKTGTDRDKIGTLVSICARNCRAGALLPVPGDGRLTPRSL